MSPYASSELRLYTNLQPGSEIARPLGGNSQVVAH